MRKYDFSNFLLAYYHLSAIEVNLSTLNLSFKLHVSRVPSEAANIIFFTIVEFKGFNKILSRYINYNDIKTWTSLDVGDGQCQYSLMMCPGCRNLLNTSRAQPLKSLLIEVSRSLSSEGLLYL